MMATRQMKRYLTEQKHEPGPLVYEVRADKLSSVMMSKFVQSRFDRGTEEYLEDFCRQSEGCCKTFMLNTLRLFYSVTDSNAILGRGQMHVVSEAHLTALLRAAATASTDAVLDEQCALLDIGSGDGNVTRNIARVCCLGRGEQGLAGDAWKQRVTTTEVSCHMVKRLRADGLRCLEVMTCDRQVIEEHLAKDGVDVGGNGPLFRVVSCFNVLDRCDTPLTLLRQCRALLLPRGHGKGDPIPEDCGVLLLAVVLPWNAFVESGSGQRRPSERVPVRGPGVIWAKQEEDRAAAVPAAAQEPSSLWARKTTGTDYSGPRVITQKNKLLCACCCSFEEAAEWFIHNLLAKVDFEVLSWTRVPYISAGDMNTEYYTLNNAVFVCRPVAHD